MINVGDAREYKYCIILATLCALSAGNIKALFIALIIEASLVNISYK
jgi:hypothetical protein